LRPGFFAAGAVEKAEIGVQMEMDETRSAHAGGHCNLLRGIWLSVYEPEKGLSRRARRRRMST
jgi:hypothetical protein